MAKLVNGRRLVPTGWTFWYSDPVLIVAISLVFALDQITKAVVRHSLLVGESISLGGAVRITHTFNTGSAFGLFPQQTLLLILASVVGIGLLILVYRNHPFPGFLVRLSLGMQLGGALGNLVDRVRERQVTDFIELGFWPIFNLADASIVIGLILLVYLFLFTGKLKRPSMTGDAPELTGSPVDGIGGVSPDPNPGVDDRRRVEEAPRERLDQMADMPCPICDHDMYRVPGGWRCSGCGVREWVEVDR